MYKCKQNLNPPVFCNILSHRTKTKYVLRNENSIQELLCRTNLVSTVFHPWTLPLKHNSNFK